jgi:hypothetical protein
VYKFYWMIVLGCLTLTSLGSRVAEARRLPINETLDWLRETINHKATNSGKGPCVSNSARSYPCPWHYEAVNFSGCEVSWVFVQASNAPGSFGIRDEVTMPLWEDFDPAPFASSTERDIWSVVFQLKDISSQKSSQKMTLTIGTSKFVKAESQSFTRIDFGTPGEDNKDTAERVAKGFSHAVQLCQDWWPRNKEPF